MSVRARLAALSVPSRFALLAVLGTAVVLLSYLFFVRTGIGQQIDEAARWVSRRVPQDVADPLRGPLGVVSIESVALAGLAAMAIAWFRRRWWLGFAVGGMVVAANVTTQVLKKVVLQRPDLFDGGGFFTVNSLPSGHVTAMASIAFAFVLAVSYRSRIWVASAAFLATATAGVAVLATNTHFPSDSIAAIGVVLAWAGVAGWFVSYVSGSDTESDAGWIRVELASRIVAAAIAALGAIAILGVLVIATWERSEGLVASRSTFAYLVSSAGIVAFAAASLLGVLSAMHNVSLERTRPRENPKPNLDGSLAGIPPDQSD